MKHFNHIIVAAYSHTNIRVCLLCLALAALTLSLGGCGVTKSIDDVISEIDQTRQTIERISSGWRDELPKLVNDLNGLESQVNSDVKGTVADTTNQIQDLAAQTIQLSDAKAQDLIAQAGVEFRCNTNFVKEGVVAQLQYIIDDLKFWKQNKRHLDKKPNHVVCWINPSVLSLYPSGSNWAIDTSNMSDKNIVHVFGYNFWSEELPTLELQDANAQKIHDVNLKAAYVTHYQINLDFSNEDFAAVKPGARAIFRWPDQDDPNTINLTLHPPARLKIGNPNFTPSSPTALKDAVILKVTVTNTGGLRSGEITVVWKPDPLDKKVFPITLPKPLDPGEPKIVSFPGYVYQRGGTINTVVSLNSGDDTLNYPLNVAAPPPLTEESSLIDTSNHFGFLCDMRENFDVNIDAPQGYTWDGDSNNVQIIPIGSRAGDNPGLGVVGTPTMQGQTLQLKVHVGLDIKSPPCGTLYIQAKAGFVWQLH